MLLRTTVAALAALLIALPAAAPASSQLRANVAREMPHYVPGVDVSRLSSSQLAAIYSIMHSPRTHSDKIGSIRSVLGGGFSLRGLIFR